MKRPIYLLVAAIGAVILAAAVFAVAEAEDPPAYGSIMVRAIGPGPALPWRVTVECVDLNGVSCPTRTAHPGADRNPVLVASLANGLYTVTFPTENARFRLVDIRCTVDPAEFGEAWYSIWLVAGKAYVYFASTGNLDASCDFITEWRVE